MNSLPCVVLGLPDGQGLEFGEDLEDASVGEDLDNASAGEVFENVTAGDLWLLS